MNSQSGTHLALLWLSQVLANLTGKKKKSLNFKKSFIFVSFPVVLTVRFPHAVILSLALLRQYKQLSFGYYFWFCSACAVHMLEKVIEKK